ncbi:sulfotransferase family protein [Mesorhizobium opportunistum]
MSFQRKLQRGPSSPADISLLEAPLAFVHIPKTAGTSFVRYLESHLPAGSIAPPFLGDFSAIQISDPSKKLFWGHFRFDDMSRYLPNAKYLTFLRDPIARSYSQYKSWHDPRNFPQDDPWRKIMTPEQIDDVEFAQKVSFDEFVSGARPRFEMQLRDVQTVMLSHRPAGTSEFLLSAKHNLQGMFFFGIVEDFDKSISQLQKKLFGLRSYTVPTELENRSDGRKLSLSSKGEERLVELLQNDIELYKFAVELFCERKKQAL